MRKVIELTVRIEVNMNDGINVDEFVNELDYDFTSTTKGVRIINTEITDFNELE